MPGGNKSAMVFTLEGDAVVSGTPVAAKTAAKLGEGDTVTIEAGVTPIEILFKCSERLGEPIAWYGPVVMNTHQELLERSIWARSSRRRRRTRTSSAAL